MLLYCLLVAVVLGETHQLEAVLTDKLGVTNTKLLLSNVKSTKPEASLEFDGSVSFPCVVRIPASIQWDEIRYNFKGKIIFYFFTKSSKIHLHYSL